MLEGLRAVEEMWHNREGKIKTLKTEGRKVAGYLCCYVPLEILTAADLIPYRIIGSLKEPLDVVGSYLEDNFCPYIRSCFEIAMKGKYDFLDAYITPDTCDNIVNFYPIWLYTFKTPFTHYITVPHIPDAASIRFFKEEIVYFKRVVEEFIGRGISNESIIKAIHLHNENRSLLRELYELRKQIPPLLRGSEVIKIMVTVMSLPIEEANHLLRGIMEEAKARPTPARSEAIRLFVSGNEMDDPSFMELIEESNGEVVADDLCIGTRYFWHDVKLTDDPLDGLSIRYLDKIMCPHTFRGLQGGWETRKEELNLRFGHIKSFIRDFHADGAIIYVLRFCDSEEWDLPDLKDYLEEAGIPVLPVESDYFLMAKGRLKMMIEAFIEQIEERRQT